MASSETSSTSLAFKNVKGGDFRATGEDGITYRVRKISDGVWHVLTQLAGETKWDRIGEQVSKEEAQAFCQRTNDFTPPPVPPVEELPAGLDASKIVAGSFGTDELPAEDEPVDDGADAAVRKDLRSITRRRNQAATRLDELDAELRDRVVAAFGAGMTVRPIMDDTGLSKSRVYQIRDGRR